jgi:hypothetical protein
MGYGSIDVSVTGFPLPGTRCKYEGLQHPRAAMLKVPTPSR